MIKYDKMFALFKQKGYNYSSIRKEKIIPEGTLQAIREGRGGLSHKVIDRVCEVLDCQPGDLMEYVSNINPDFSEDKNETRKMTLDGNFDPNQFLTDLKKEVDRIETAKKEDSK